MTRMNIPSKSETSCLILSFIGCRQQEPFLVSMLLDDLRFELCPELYLIPFRYSNIYIFSVCKRESIKEMPFSVNATLTFMHGVTQSVAIGGCVQRKGSMPRQRVIG